MSTLVLADVPPGPPPKGGCEAGPGPAEIVVVLVLAVALACRFGWMRRRPG